VAIDVNNDIDVALVTKLAEIPPEEFQVLNPSFNKPMILAAANQQILLPFGHAEVFQENLKKYTKPLSSWTAVQVAKTEMVDQTAKTLGVDAETLRSINDIPKGMRVRAGSTVIIPKTSRRPGDISVALADNASLSLEKPPPPAPPSKKCKKGAKCTPVKTANSGTKGNSSAKNVASQHKSASTGLAKSAKNDPVKTSTSKGVGKIQ